VGSYTQLNSCHWNTMQYTHGSPYINGPNRAMCSASNYRQCSHGNTEHPASYIYECFEPHQRTLNQPITSSFQLTGCIVWQLFPFIAALTVQVVKPASSADKPKLAGYTVIEQPDSTTWFWNQYCMVCCKSYWIHWKSRHLRFSLEHVINGPLN